MDQHSYEREIKKAYDLEVLGEAFFLALATPARSPEQRQRLQTLARLETEMARAVKPLVDRLGIEPADAAEEVKKGIHWAAPYEALDWPGLLTKLKAVLEPFVETYDGLALRASPEDKAILNRLAAHERALLSFADAELAGRSDHSLDPVIALLDPIALLEAEEEASPAS